MNILLTGASGYLGKEIESFFLEKGYSLISVGRNRESSIVCDLAEKVPQLPLEIEFEFVIHAAGKAHVVPRTLNEEQEFFKANFEGTKNLCYALDKLITKPRALIFISSVAVYGVDEGVDIDESYPLKGDSPYSKSKIQAEEWLSSWSDTHNVILGILRLPLIAGRNPPGNLGQMINGIKKNRYLSIGKANAHKSVVWIKDIAPIMLTLAKIGGVYNLTDGYHPSFGELEKAIADAFGKKEPYHIPLFFAKLIAQVGELIGDSFPINTRKLNKITSSLTFNDFKARNALGWKPSSVIEKISLII